MGKLIEIIYGRVGDFVSNSHLVNGKIVIVDSNLRSITVDADNGGGHAYVDIVPSLGTLPVSLGDYAGPTPIFGIGDPESTSYYVSWSFKYSRWIETKKTATPIEETVGTTTTRTWEPHPWEIFANGWYIFNMEDKLISTLKFAPRYVGDKDTAPPPSFASFTSPNATYNGYGIVDVFRFQGRLAILTEQTVVLSRIDDEFNFWPSTASKVLPTDPIDIKIGEGLRYAVPWQNRILIFGKTNSML